MFKIPINPNKIQKRINVPVELQVVHINEYSLDTPDTYIAYVTNNPKQRRTCVKIAISYNKRWQVCSAGVMGINILRN